MNGDRPGTRVEAFEPDVEIVAGDQESNLRDVGSGAAGPGRLLGQRDDAGILPGRFVESAIEPDDGVAVFDGNRLGGGGVSAAESQANGKRESPDDGPPAATRPYQRSLTPN